MEIIRDFKKLDKNDATIAGGKGASLGEMTKAGISVPPGFVILSNTFEKFLEETDLNVEIDTILHSVNHKEIHTVENASEKIQALILGVEMSDDIVKEIKIYFKKLNAKYVAVRSSATAEDSSTAAWAGQLESYLNTTEENLLENVKKCWASLFTPRAIFYSFEKDLHKQKISVAVVVQKMIESEVSGIAFSVHPVTQDRNQLIIEAGFGLGEAIVSGQITPDSYVIEKEPRRIIDKNVIVQTKGIYRNGWKNIEEEKGKQQALSDKQILELSELILKIENHYAFPVDIEWAFGKGKFYIVQSRPITTLTKEAPTKKENVTVINGIEWMHTVTRNMSFWHQYLSNEGHYYHSKDFGIDAELDSLYTTVEGTKTYYFMHKENLDRYNAKLLSRVDEISKIDDLKKIYQKFGRELIEALEKAKNNLTPGTWDVFQDQYKKYCAGLYLTAGLGRIGTETLISLLKENGYEDSKIPDIIAKITYPSEHTPLFNSQLELLSIGANIQSKEVSEKEIKKLLLEWLGKYSHIPVNFCDEPWTLNDAKNQLKSMMIKDCKSEMEKQESVHRYHIEEAKKTLAKIKNKEIHILAHALAEGTYINETRKNIFSRVSLEFRPMFAMIAKKAGSSDWKDAFYLTPEEMIEILKGKKYQLKEIVNDRKIAGAITKEKKTELLSKNTATSLAEHVELKNSGQKNFDVEGVQKEIKGFSANKGVITGTVKIILSSKDFHKLNPGEILVTTMTSVDFVPVMERAGAFITNEGGITSHASIVAREMNKPCIIGTKIATQVLKDGDIVEVDADNGVVKILDKNIQQGEKWEVFRSRYIPSILPIYVYWSWNVKDFLEVDRGMVVNVWEEGNFTAVWEKEAAKNVGQKIVRRLENMDDLDSLRKKGIKAGEKVVDYCKDFSKTKLSSEKMVGFLNKVTDLYHDFMRANMIYWLFTGGVIEKEIKDRLVKYGDHASEIFSTMASPIEKSYSKKLEEEFASLVELARKKAIRNIKKEIKGFSEKYIWFPYEYIGPDVWDEKVITKRIEESLNAPMHKEPAFDLASNQKQCIKEYGLSNEVIKYF